MVEPLVAAKCASNFAQEGRVVAMSLDEVKAAPQRSHQSLSGEFAGHTKGCCWSPDGTCLLAGGDDNAIRLFELPEKTDEQVEGESQTVELPVALTVHEAETIYDYQWYPLMNSNDPGMCCFASTSRDTPVHLWDAFTGICPHARGVCGMRPN